MSWILFVAQASSLNSRMRPWMRAHIQISSAVTAGLGGAFFGGGSASYKVMVLS